MQYFKEEKLCEVLVAVDYFDYLRLDLPINLEVSKELQQTLFRNNRVHFLYLFA